MLNQLKINQYERKRLHLIEHILHNAESGVASQKYFDVDVIVSLTSYGKRINDVAFSIESIMQQSMKANRIILWLDTKYQTVDLPQSIINQIKRGLEVRFCKDIRSYTKIIPTLREYPNNVLITVDDDVLYEYDILERLITAYKTNPNFIHSCRVHRMITDQNGRLFPYNCWKLKYPEAGPNVLNFLTGVGGVLYPPYCLDKEVLNEDVFLDICKYADDVWLNAMALKKGTLINKVLTRQASGNDYIANPYVQDVGLKNINTKGENLNDTQIKAVFTKYSLYSRLK